MWSSCFKIGSFKEMEGKFYEVMSCSWLWWVASILSDSLHEFIWIDIMALQSIKTMSLLLSWLQHNHLTINPTMNYYEFWLNFCAMNLHAHCWFSNHSYYYFLCRCDVHLHFPLHHANIKYGTGSFVALWILSPPLLVMSLLVFYQIVKVYSLGRNSIL